MGSYLVDSRDELRQSLKRNAQEILTIADALKAAFDKQNQVITHFTEYTDDFARLNTAEMQAQFASLDLARRKERALALATEALNKNLGGQTDLDPAVASGKIEQGVQAIGEDVGQWWRGDAKPKVEYDHHMAQAVNGHAVNASALRTLQERLDGLRQEQLAVVAEIERSIRESLAGDTKAQVEANQRSQAESRLARAAKARDEYLRIYEELQHKRVERAALMAALTRKQLEISGARATQRNTLVNKLNDFRTERFSIGVEFHSGQDRAAMVEFLSKGFLSGLGVQHKARRWPELLSMTLNPCELAEKIWEKEAAALAIRGEVAGQEKAISDEEANCLIEKPYPMSNHDGAAVPLLDKARLQMLLELEAVPWDDLVQITLNGQPVERLSPGQRSSAMLPLIALSETTPLVIDQPEDNLDNRLVGEVVAGILGELKERRQVIAATHNPNIVVSGDAEQVIVLDAVDDRHGKLLDHGSIDVPTIVAQVIATLEGGKEAFCARKERYDL